MADSSRPKPVSGYGAIKFMNSSNGAVEQYRIPSTSASPIYLTTAPGNGESPYVFVPTGSYDIKLVVVDNPYLQSSEWGVIGSGETQTMYGYGISLP